MKKKNSYNALVVDRLKIKYGVSRRFVTMSLSGERVSEVSETIKKEYKTLTEKVERALKG